MKRYTYNEHDENQVYKILKQKKKRKVKKNIKILSLIILGIGIIALLQSPILKVKSISIKGLQLIEEKDILEHISIDQT